ncbi:MAG: leucine-rich repeat domain-containing protein [Prevotellaceae bacterium]|nr:leucine-rich repeat domain-containing protein [Prevotellaceae bacterium]
MKKNIFLALLSAVVLIVASISCSKDDNPDGDNGLKTGQVVMKVNPELSGQKNLVSFGIQAKEVTIDWGDGTVEIFTPNGDEQEYQHEYADVNLKEITLNTENLTELYVGHDFYANKGNYRELTFGSCPDLTELYCWHEYITSIDISKCTALQTLWLNGNQLTSLDVSKCTELKELEIDDNQLTSLDVSKCTDLQTLWIVQNQLTGLDVSKCPDLEVILCDNNQLTSLDVSKCTYIHYLDVANNKLTASALNNLFGTLPIKASGNHANIYIKNNPGTDECDKSIAENKGWDVY